MTTIASRIPTFFLVSLGLHILGIFLLVGLSRDYETLAMPKGGVLITLGSRPQQAAPPPRPEPVPEPEVKQEPVRKEPEPTPPVTPKVVQKKALVEQQVEAPKPVKKIEKKPKPIEKPVKKPIPQPKPKPAPKPAPEKPPIPKKEETVKPQPTPAPASTVSKTVPTGRDNRNQQLNQQTGAAAQQAGSAQGSASGSDAVSSYRALISEKLAKHKSYPRRAKIRKQQGTVLITFILAADGSLLDLYISKSSGYHLLDDATLKMVKKSAPFAPFPKSYTDKTMTFKYPVSYNIK